MKRALTPENLLNKKIETVTWDKEFVDAFDNPETTGIWFVFGNSGNGKTSLLLKMAKQFAARKIRVVFNSREEGDSYTMKRAYERENILKVNGHMLLVNETIEQLAERLRKPKSPKIVIIDSIQYCRFKTQDRFFDFVNEFEKSHLIIFNSQAKGKEPRGSIAETAFYHASLKIWVEGFRAISHGRYYGTLGYYDIWPEKSLDYWLIHNH